MRVQKKESPTRRIFLDIDRGSHKINGVWAKCSLYNEPNAGLSEQSRSEGMRKGESAGFC